MDGASAAERRLIFHIALEADWTAASRAGTYRVSTRGATLDDVGYIHASFEHQLPTIGTLLYHDVREPLVVLVIETGKLASPVVVENLDGGSEDFPHIYGPLQCDAVIAGWPASVKPDGFRMEPSNDA